MTMNLQTCESSEIAAFSSASVAAAAAAAAVVEAPPPPPTTTTMVVEGSGSPSSSRPGSRRGSGIRSVGSSSRPGSRRGSGVSLSSNGGRRGSFRKRGSFLHLESTVADRTRHLLESLAHSSLQGSMEFLKDALPSPSSFRRGDNNKKVHKHGGNKEVKELEHGDVEVGKLVGKGGFSRVYELKAVRRRSFLNSLMMNNSEHDDDDERRSENDGGSSSASSEVVAKNFVVKHLNASVLCSEDGDGDRYRAAAADLAFEAKLLSSISHPNIVRLRGVTRGCEISALYAGGKLQQQQQQKQRGGERGEGDGVGFGGGYFIVLDKLECTLTERIVEWSKEKKALKKKSKSNKAVGNWARKRSSVILRRSSSVFGGPEGDDDDEQPSGWKVGRRSSAILRHRTSSVCDPEDEDEQQQPSGWKVNRRSSAFLRRRSSSVCDPEEEEQQPSAWKVTRRTSATLRHRASSIEDRASSMMGDEREDGNVKPTAVEHGSSQLKIQSPARPSRRGGRRSSLGARFRRRSTCSSFSSEASGGGGGGNDDNDEKELVRSNHSTNTSGTAATSSSRTLPSDHKDSERRCDDQKRDFLRRRLDVALQIARAVAYMHSRRILYRDLKPDNVGFDSVTGDVKIFDFGLARFLPTKREEHEGAGGGDEEKKLTGTAGTPRYMAPEVAKCLHYGLEADVYSFGLLLWEILSLKRPFGKISPKELQEKVVYGTKRPKVDRLKWPETVCDLMETCWSSDPSERPGFGRILQVLDREVDTLAM